MFGTLLSKFKKTVLVIEDEEGVRQALVDKLSREGFKPIPAEDGDEGLRLAFKYRPRVVLLDLMMPGTDGVQVLEHLRADPWGSTVPIIIVSNLLEDEALVKRYNVHRYIVKSDWKIEDVALKVKEVMKEGK